MAKPWFGTVASAFLAAWIALSGALLDCSTQARASPHAFSGSTNPSAILAPSSAWFSLVPCGVATTMPASSFRPDRRALSTCLPAASWVTLETMTTFAFSD